MACPDMQLIGTRMKVVEGATYQIDNIGHLVHGNSINRVVSQDFVCDRILAPTAMAPMRCLESI